MKEGIIKFNGYYMEDMNYSRNNNYEFTSEYFDLSPQFLFKIVVSEDTPNKYNLIMGARVGYLDQSPFLAEVIIRGFFEIRDGQNEEKELENLYIINSSAILFPYLRSTLTDITSKSDHDPVMLPTFNFHTIIDGLNKEELFINPKEYREYI